MRFSSLLELPKGIISIIGSGGKTTLLRTLAGELPDRVILCTTTHILPFSEYPLVTDGNPQAIQLALERHRVVCVGQPGAEGKLAAPTIPLVRLQELAPWVLIEADGSRQLPLKAHAAHEPVIPKENGCTVCVVGASGFGKRIDATIHRPELFCRLTGAEPNDLVTPELAARALVLEGLAQKVFLNQVETPEDWVLAERLSKVLSEKGICVFAGSLWNGFAQEL